MYKTFFLNLIFFFLCFLKTSLLAFSPDTETEKVSVRVAKHPEFLRVVFTLSEESFNKTSVSTTNEKLVKVIFPRPVSLVSYQQGVEKIILRGEGFIEVINGVKIMAGSHFCLIQIEKMDNFKLTRLNVPPRIVIDAYYSIESLSSPAPSKPAFQQTETSIKKPFGYFVIDPGHGGYDKGIYDENNREKDIALNIAKEMAQILSAGNKKVILTRKADQRLSIRERLGVANRHTHNIFLSLHISANEDCIIYTYPFKDEKNPINDKKEISEDIVESLIKTLKNDFGFNIRHEKLPLPILKGLSTLALLIELPHFNHFSYDKKNREALIKSIIKGLTATTAN